MEILKFIKWQWTRFELWQKVYLFCFLAMISSLFLNDPYDYYVWTFSIIVIFGYFIKWFIFDSLKNSYEKYKKEKSELFNFIKESDK
jgi:hydrogenase-4 membrane subunit HyfE